MKFIFQYYILICKKTIYIVKAIFKFQYKNIYKCATPIYIYYYSHAMDTYQIEFYLVSQFISCIDHVGTLLNAGRICNLTVHHKNNHCIYKKKRKKENTSAFIYTINTIFCLGAVQIWSHTWFEQPLITNPT